MPIHKDELPEFDAAPLNEVVLGVQFQTPRNFDQIKAFEVWQLYADRFSVVRDQMPMAPQFEMFGASQPQHFTINLAGAPQSRFWFESKMGDQLIQFQHDRLFHNWRKVDAEGTEYPRFESIITQFEAELRELERYFQRLGNERLFVTQCELSYLNNILVTDEPAAITPQKWLTFVNQDQWPVEEFSYFARRALHRDDGQPYGRFYRESATGVDRFGRRIILLNLTARGLVAPNDIAGTLDFLNEHRYMITDEFIDGTTAEAQKIWKRIR